MNYEVAACSHHSVPTKLSRDKRLSFRARGIAIRLLSNAPGYRMSAIDLARESATEGRFAILTAMRELRALGYAHVIKHQDARGRWSTVTRIYGEPRPGADDRTSVPEVQQPNSGRPASGGPRSGRPRSGNRTATSSSSKKILLQEETTTAALVHLDWSAKGLEALSENDRARAQAMLDPLGPETQQDILDELAARVEETSVVSPMGLLIELIARARSGTFNVSRGRRLGAKRRYVDVQSGSMSNTGAMPESPFMNSVNWAYQQFRVDADKQALRDRLLEADARWPDEAQVYRHRSSRDS